MNSFRANRRDILKTAGATLALQQLGGMQSSAIAADQSGDYRALVCIFLLGGNDSFNVLTPTTSGEREDYVTARGGTFGSGTGGLAHDETGLHEITDSTSGRTFGLHPAAGPLADIYNQGDLTFVANTGSLFRPTTLQDYEANRDLPVGLFSHSDLQRHLMSAMPDQRATSSGWAGRLADEIQSGHPASGSVPSAIAINDNNRLQIGATSSPYVVTTSGVEPIRPYVDGSSFSNRVLRRVADDWLIRNHRDSLVEQWVSEASKAIDFQSAFDDAVSLDTDLSQFFGSDPSSLQSDLEMVTRVIAAQSALGHPRQTFYVGVGGWDHHNELQNAHQALVQKLTNGLASFYNAIESLGMLDCVTTFTMSDFGRTLSSNTRGTDHGWGGNEIVMGGSVQGGRIYGDYPFSLSLGGPLDVGRGRLLPTTSNDEYAAELALWFGIPNDETLSRVLPNIREFFSQNDSAPLGMLG